MTARESYEGIRTLNYQCHIHTANPKHDCVALALVIAFGSMSSPLKLPRESHDSPAALWESRGPVGVQGPCGSPGALWESRGPVGVQECLQSILLPNVSWS